MNHRVMAVFIWSIFFFNFLWGANNNPEVSQKRTNDFRVNNSAGTRGTLNEGFESGAIPSDWTVYDNDGDGNHWLANSISTYAHSGTYSASIHYNASGNDDWLITPKLQVTSANHTFSVWARSRSSSYLEDMVIRLSTSGTDTADFTVTLGQVNGVPISYTQYSYDLSDYIGQAVYIAIVCVSVDEYYLHVDDITGPDLWVPSGLPGDPTNPSPSDGATNVSTGTSLSWTNGSNTDSTIVLFGTSSTPGDTVYNGPATTTLSNSQIGGPLVHDTEYYWQVISINNVGKTTGSVWQFRTALANHTLPVSEDFENGFQDFGNAGGNGTDWSITTNFYHEGSHAAHNAYGSSETNILHETGEIDLSSSSSPRLYFWQIAKTEGGYDKCYVEISTDGGATYDTIPSAYYHGKASEFKTRHYFHEDSYSIWGTTDVTPENTWWKQEVFDLSAYKTTHVRIRFRLESDGSVQRYGWLLDAVEIKEAPPNAVISVSPDTLNMGEIMVWETSSRRSIITNEGGADLVITNISAAEPFSCSYSGTITPLSSDTAVFQFAPYEEGEFSALAHINISGSYSGEDTVRLFGTAYSPDSTLEEDFDDNDSLKRGWGKLVKASSEESDVSITSSSYYTQPNAVRIFNSSDRSGFISLYSRGVYKASGGNRLRFYAKASSNNEKLVVGEITNLQDTTTFQPVDTLSISNTFQRYTVEYTSTRGATHIAFRHGMENANVSFYIDHVTWEKKPTSPIYQISPDSAGFGVVNLGDTSAFQDFTITNDGAGTLTIQSVSLTGNHADQFVLEDTHTYPVDLSANQSMVVQVAFAPTSGGDKSAQLQVVDNLSRNTHNYPLTGTGNDPNYGGGGSAQGGYYFANSLATNAPSHPQFNWVDIASATNDSIDALGDEVVIGPIPLGFTFNFFGTDYTELYFSSNGWISFTQPSSANFSNQHIPDSNTPNNIIALFWDDLNAKDFDVNDRHCYVGKAPNGDFVISLVHYPEYGADENGWITAQVILKPGGNIKLQYKEHGTSIDLDGATVGIENQDGTQGVEYRYNTSGGPLFGSPLAVEFGLDDQSLPVELTSFVARAGNNRAYLQWTTQSEVNNLGFEVYRSLNKEGEYQLIASYQNYENLRGAGNSNTPHQYAFTDANVSNGITYYYKLADVTMNGQRHFHGPVSVIPNKNGIDLENSGVIPKTFALKNNFPNPFNPTTTIGFDIPMVPDGKIQVELIIYNTLGQKVRTLVSDQLSPGTYRVQWDGRNDNGHPVANGIYFYGIRTERFVRFHKMILMK